MHRNDQSQYGISFAGKKIEEDVLILNYLYGNLICGKLKQLFTLDKKGEKPTKTKVKSVSDLLVKTNHVKKNLVFLPSFTSKD